MATCSEGKIFRALCKASEPYSIVGFAHSDDRFGAFVGILGEYIGTIHVPAVMEAFPMDGEHQMGHVIQLQRPGFARVSMKQALESFLKAIKTANANKEADTQP